MDGRTTVTVFRTMTIFFKLQIRFSLFIVKYQFLLSFEIKNKWANLPLNHI